MSNVNEMMTKLGLRGETSVNTAIVRVSEYLERWSDREATNLLEQLGVQGIPTHPVEADIMLKTAVELIVKGIYVSPEDTHAQGLVKIDQIRARMPYVFVLPETITKVDEEGNVVQKRSKGEKNDKNAKSLAFVKEMHDKGETDRGVITNALAEHLETDYAGAYFYVKKSEKVLGIELTAVRGRKASKKATAE